MNGLQDLFIAILNMSITASYVVAGVLIVRLALKKAPKIFSYILWVPVLFRLICPFSFSSALSFLGLLNVNQKDSISQLEYVPSALGLMQQPVIQSGMDNIDRAVNASLHQATPVASSNPIQILLAVLSLVWILGIIVLLSHSVISYLKMHKQLQTATLVKDNVYESDRISTAFVFGLLHPRIYIPVGISGADLAFILEHERTHIRRKDYLIKAIAFLALVIHWFNPLIWLAYSLMSRDMEMSCDESVLQRMNLDVRKGYSNSLLALSVKRNRLFMANPLAFGESDVKARIKNVLNYKRPPFWVILIAIVVTLFVTIVFTANPKQLATDSSRYKGYDIEALLENKTPYVGDNSKVVALIDALSLPQGIVRDTVGLETTTSPYEITINYIMKDSSEVMADGAISGQDFYRNCIVLFSLIDNVDIINCIIVDKTGRYEGASYKFPFTREAAEELMNEDVRSFADSADTLKSLIDRISSIHPIYNPDRALLNENEHDHGLEIVDFADDMVEIAGRKLAYDNVDLAPLYETLTPLQVEKMMYRAVIYYESVHQKDFKIINSLSSSELKAEMDKWGKNEETKPAVDVMMQLDNYTDVDFPVGITAPIQYEDKFVVILTLDETMSSTVTFKIDEANIPKVTELMLDSI